MYKLFFYRPNPLTAKPLLVAVASKREVCTMDILQASARLEKGVVLRSLVRVCKRQIFLRVFVCGGAVACVVCLCDYVGERTVAPCEGIKIVRSEVINRINVCRAIATNVFGACVRRVKKPSNRLPTENLI